MFSPRTYQTIDGSAGLNLLEWVEPNAGRTGWEFDLLVEGKLFASSKTHGLFTDRITDYEFANKTDTHLCMIFEARAEIVNLKTGETYSCPLKLAQPNNYFVCNVFQKDQLVIATKHEVFRYYLKSQQHDYAVFSKETTKIESLRIDGNDIYITFKDLESFLMHTKLIKFP